MTSTNTVTQTVGELKTHLFLDNKLWGTPGSSSPYWARNASFMYDEVVASIHDFQDEEGWAVGDFDDGDDEWEDHQLCAEIVMPVPL